MVLPTPAASLSGRSLASGSSAALNVMDFLGIGKGLLLAVERLDSLTLPGENEQAGQRDHESDEEERGPAEPEVFRVGGGAGRRSYVDAAEGWQRREKRVLGRREAVV